MGSEVLPVPSPMPNRSCNHAKVLDAHQFHRPITCINAETRTIPHQGIHNHEQAETEHPHKNTWAANDIDITNSAAVITRPVQATPSATLSSLAAGAWAVLGLADRAAQEINRYSRSRAIKNTEIICGQSKRDAEQQHRHVGHQRPSRGCSQRAEMTVLEDPHRRAKRCSQ